MNHLVPLGSVVDFIRGITFKPDDLVGPGDDNAVVCMRTKNIQAKLDTSDLIAVPSRLVRRDELFLKPSDLLISSANSWNLVGKTVYVGDLAYPATAGGFISIVRPRSSVVNARYLYHWITCPKTQEVIRNCGRQTTNISNLSVERFLGLEIPLPSLQEQHRIAAILDKADAVRKKRREALKLADEFLRSVFLDMFGDPVRNHKGWIQSTLGEIAPGRGEIVDGPFGSSLKPDQYVDEGVRVIRNFNVRPGYFDPSAYKYVTLQKFAEIRRSEVTEGDLLLSTKGTVGNVCLMPRLEGPSVLSATGTVRIRVSSPDVETLFLMYQMLTSQYQRYIEEHQSGAVQQYLNLSGIRDLAIILPPRELQSQFTEIARRVSVLAEKCNCAYREADKLFGSLAHRAFSGQL